MIKKTISYTDYEGVARKEDFFFNLSKAEMLDLELGRTGGMKKFLEKIVAEQDSAKIIEHFKDLILRSYGEKSPDGKRFVKSKELAEAFSQTEAFSELYVELAFNASVAAEFINGVIPQNFSGIAEKPKVV